MLNGHLLKCVVAGGQHDSRIVLIPRIVFRPNSDDGFPFEWERRQFPVRVAFTMTINKSQRIIILFHLNIDRDWWYLKIFLIVGIISYHLFRIEPIVSRCIKYEPIRIHLNLKYCIATKLANLFNLLYVLYVQRDCARSEQCHLGTKVRISLDLKPNWIGYKQTVSQMVNHFVICNHFCCFTFKKLCYYF